VTPEQNREWLHQAAHDVAWKNGFKGKDTIIKWYKSRPVCNQVNIATLFLSQFDDVICFIKKLNRWYYFDGKVWREDSAGNHTLRTMLMDFIDELIEVIDESRKYYTDDDDKKIQDKYHSWAVGLNNHQSLDNILAVGASKCNVSMDTFDTDDELFNVSNGTIDLLTGELRPHNPHDRITVLCDEEYDPNARYDKWDDTVLRACGERAEYVRYLQMEFGYALTGLTDEEVLFLLLGKELTGKSTFYEPIMEVLGDYGHYMAFDTVKDADYEGGGAREDLLRLRVCRLVMCSEVNPKTKFDAALVKKITSGEKIVARGLYARDSLEFSPKFKVCIGTNYAPIIPYDDGGSHRRVKVNPFKSRIAEDQKDKKIKKEFKTVKEARQRILAWLVEGRLLLLNEDGGLDHEPREVIRANQEYIRSQNPLSLFINDYCVADRYGKATVKQLVDAFNFLKAEYGGTEISPKSLGRLMKPLEAQFTKNRTSKERYYEGIRLKTLKERDDDIDFYDVEEQNDVNDALDLLCSTVKCGDWFVNVVTYDVYNTLFLLNRLREHEDSYRDFIGKGGSKRQTSSIDQHDLASSFFSIVQKLKSAGPIAIENKAQLLKVVSERIQAEHAEWCDYDVLGFCTKLAENNTEAQSLMADLTGGA